MYVAPGNILSLVGGYNFTNGQDGWRGGDIFIDINPGFAPTNVDGGVGSIEPPNVLGANGGGYDYVIDISPVDGTYDVYAISGLTVGSGLLSAFYFPQSNPWRLVDNYSPGPGQSVQWITSGSFAMTTYATDAALDGGTWNSGYLPDGADPAGLYHYVLGGFDLSFLTSPSYYIHYTQQCGNDVLTGLVIPEPSTYVLFGLGLAALAARRKFAKAH